MRASSDRKSQSLQATVALPAVRTRGSTSTLSRGRVFVRWCRRGLWGRDRHPGIGSVRACRWRGSDERSTAAAGEAEHAADSRDHARHLTASSRAAPCARSKGGEPGCSGHQPTTPDGAEQGFRVLALVRPLPAGCFASRGSGVRFPSAPRVCPDQSTTSSSYQ